MAMIMETLTSVTGGSSKGMFAAIAGIAAVSGTAFKMFDTVSTSQVGIPELWGNAYHTKGRKKGKLRQTKLPGRHLVIPFIYSINKVGIATRTNDIRAITITDDSERLFLVDSYVQWSVRSDGDNPARSLYNVNDGELTQSVVSTCTAGLRSVLNGRPAKDISVSDPEALQAEVMNITHDELLEYGVKLRTVGIIEAREKDIERLRGAMGDASLTSLGMLAGSELIETQPGGDPPFIFQRSPDFPQA